jgi:hypothetical protein
MQEEGDTEDAEDVERAPTPHAPRHNPPGRLAGDMRQHKLEAVVGSGKKKYLHKPCRICTAHKKGKGTKYICFFCKVLPQKKLLPKVPHAQQILGCLLSTHIEFQQNKLSRKKL